MAYFIQVKRDVPDTSGAQDWRFAIGGHRFVTLESALEVANTTIVKSKPLAWRIVDEKGILQVMSQLANEDGRPTGNMRAAVEANTEPKISLIKS